MYYKQFHEILNDQYIYYDQIYTDGSKDENSVSSASIPFNPIISVHSQRIPPTATIFTAEANAINMALKDNGEFNKNCFVLITDFLSCLMALKSSDVKILLFLN